MFSFSGSPLWLLLNIAPIRNEKDQVILILCTFKDITALKQPIDDENAKGYYCLSISNEYTVDSRYLDLAYLE